MRSGGCSTPRGLAHVRVEVDSLIVGVTHTLRISSLKITVTGRRNCTVVIPQDLWRCPCPSENSGLAPLASLLCPAPPIMNGCMKAAVFVGTRRKITDFPTSHVQVCFIWLEPGGVEAACRSHSRDFSCCPD